MSPNSTSWARRRWRARPWLILLTIAAAFGVGFVNTFRGTLGKDFKPELEATIKPGAARLKRGVEVELSPLIMIPGSSYARVKIFDEAGSELETYEFSTGYRWNCESVRVVAYPGRPYLEILVIDCGSDISLEQLEESIGPGPYVRKHFRLRQFFGITLDDRLVPIRIEGEGSALAGLGGFGPKTTKIQSQAELIRDLRSPDPVLVFAALNSLTKERFSKEVRAIVVPLAEGKDPWIAEAASMATRAP